MGCKWALFFVDGFYITPNLLNDFAVVVKIFGCFDKLFLQNQFAVFASKKPKILSFF